MCQREVLNITCGRGEAILMTSARHGIMQPSRCFRTDNLDGLGDVIGCFANVLPHLDGMCSGRSTCLFNYPDDYLHQTKPCLEIFTVYMEVSYYCVKGIASSYNNLMYSVPKLPSNLITKYRYHF